MRFISIMIYNQVIYNTRMYIMVEYNHQILITTILINKLTYNIKYNHLNIKNYDKTHSKKT